MYARQYDLSEGTLLPWTRQLRPGLSHSQSELFLLITPHLLSEIESHIPQLYYLRYGKRFSTHTAVQQQNVVSP